MSEETYEVESIIGSRMKRNKVQYLVKWVGYSDSENTWEPLENLENAQALIDKYNEKVLGSSVRKVTGKKSDQTKKTKHSKNKKLVETKKVEKNEKIEDEEEEEDSQTDDFRVKRAKILESQIDNTNSSKNKVVFFRMKKDDKGDELTFMRNGKEKTISLREASSKYQQPLIDFLIDHINWELLD